MARAGNSTLGPSRTLCASSPSPGSRSARLPPPPAQGPGPRCHLGPAPKRKPRNARSHAWRLVSRSKLLASWLSPKFWTPECQRLSASPVSAHRLVSLFLNGLRFCLAGAQSTEEAAALAALLQYLGPEEATVNQSPCAGNHRGPVQLRTLRTLLPQARPATSGPLRPLRPHSQVFRSPNLLQTGCSELCST